MALDITAGTETLRAHHLECDTSSAALCLIFGEQHHIYTILSIIVCNVVMDASSGNTFDIGIEGFDIQGAGTGQDLMIVQNASTGANGTFVWNDKFCMNGHEPTGYSGSMTATSQADLIAAQGGVRQRLFFRADTNEDDYDVHISFIDQNNE